MNPNDIQKIIDKYGMPAWEAAQRQVWVNLISDIVWALAVAVLALLVWKAGKWIVKTGRASDDLDKDMLLTFGYIAKGLTVVPAFISVGFVVDAIQIAVNPEWAAIKVLSSLLPGNGS